jgi:methylmalonyl-CoA mutase
MLGDAPPDGLAPYAETSLADAADPEILALRKRYNTTLEALDPDVRQALAAWPEVRARYECETQSYQVREREIEARTGIETLSGLRVPRVALPRCEEWGELVRYLVLENVPGTFPFTAGVFPFKRTGEEDTTRMFAGEGPPERTNRRFHLLSPISTARWAPRASRSARSMTSRSSTRASISWIPRRPSR